jgi:DHA2 family multidrug resistance protein
MTAPQTTGPTDPTESIGPTGPAAQVPYRRTIFFGVVLGANLQALDTTMATVALPRMQGALSATQDEIAWVLAAYLIGVVIVMPLTGYLSARIGRKNLFLSATAAFIVASMLAGTSDSLSEMVIYRFLQGISAAPFIPVSQSFVFDAYTGDERGEAMGWWTMGMMSGLLLGPALGGYVTEFHSWRWACYLNVPLGLLSFFLVLVFAPVRRIRPSVPPFGFTGFFILAAALVCLQWVLSRGERLDWFSSRELVVAMGVVVALLYVFAIHTATTTRPFIDREVFRDRNFVIGATLIVMLGAQWLSFLALLSPYLQTLSGYPVVTAGMVLVPQALANGASAFLAGRLVNRVGPIPLLMFGICGVVAANWGMSMLTPGFDKHTFYAVVMLHGAGLGFFFVPLTVVTFSTLPARHTDVGTGIYALGRNLGSSIGVSLTVAYLVRQTQANHAILSENISPFNEALRHLPLPEVWRLGDAVGLAAIDAVTTQQAATLAYINDFRLLGTAMILVIPLVLLIRMPRRTNPPIAVPAE